MPSPSLIQAFCSLVIFPAFASRDHVIQGEKFYLKGLSVRWLGCNTHMSTFFDMDRKIPFNQLYGQILNAHSCKFSIRSIRQSSFCNFPAILPLYSASPNCTFRLVCITSLVELMACVTLIFFCVSAILDQVSQDRNAAWQSGHLISAGYHPLLSKAEKRLW